MYKKALHSHAQARQQEEMPWQENQWAGRQRTLAHTRWPSRKAATRRARTRTVSRHKFQQWRQRTTAQTANKAQHAVSTVAQQTLRSTVSSHSNYKITLNSADEKRCIKRTPIYPLHFCALRFPSSTIFRLAL